MRADRLVAILLLLQRHGRRSAHQLAEQLEVTPRTILRDITALSTAGIPIYGERGPHGGFRLMDGYHLDLTGLRSPEIYALFLKRQNQSLRELGWNQDAASAQEKLHHSLTAPQQELAEKVAQRFYIDETPWFNELPAQPWLKAIQEALWHQHQLAFTYTKREAAPINHTVCPYALVAKAGVWYLVAAHQNHMRVYRLSRITEATQLATTFERSPAFSLEEFWPAWTHEFEQSRPRLEVTLRIPQDIFPTFLSDPWLSAHDISASHPAPAGYLTIVATYETAETACRHLLGLGGSVAVIEPRALRAQLANEAYHLYCHNADYTVSITSETPCPPPMQSDTSP